MERRVLIADDHCTVRTGLKHILQGRFSNLEFGESITAAETLKKVRDSRWDLLILDVEIPGRNGLEVLKQITVEGIKIPVLVFSFHSEEQIAVRAFRAGAAGYLSKDAAATELLNAIDQILSGKKYIPSSVAQQLASQIGLLTDKEPHELLSDREFQILILISSGRTISQISQKLSLCPSTISTYRSRILKKMGLKTSAELMNYAMKKQLL